MQGSGVIFFSQSLTSSAASCSKTLNVEMYGVNSKSVYLSNQEGEETDWGWGLQPGMDTISSICTEEEETR